MAKSSKSRNWEENRSLERLRDRLDRFPVTFEKIKMVVKPFEQLKNRFKTITILRSDGIKQKYKTNLQKLNINRSYNKKEKAWEKRDKPLKSEIKPAIHLKDKVTKKSLGKYLLDKVVKAIIKPFGKTVTIAAKVDGKRRHMKVTVYTADQQEELAKRMRKGYSPVAFEGNKIDMLFDEEDEDWEWEQVNIKKVDS